VIVPVVPAFFSVRPSAFDGPESYSTEIEHVAPGFVRTLTDALLLRRTDFERAVTFTAIGAAPGFAVGRGVAGSWLSRFSVARGAGLPTKPSGAEGVPTESSWRGDLGAAGQGQGEERRSHHEKAHPAQPTVPGKPSRAPCDTASDDPSRGSRAHPEGTPRGHPQRPHRLRRLASMPSADRIDGMRKLWIAGLPTIVTSGRWAQLGSLSSARHDAA